MGFETFPRKTVFISGSRDMASAAVMVRSAVERANRRMAAGTGWDVYHWEKSDTVWPSDGTWQKYIPRPSDPNCGLVICLFGERVGETLPDYFPWPGDLDLPAWAAWPDPAEGCPGVSGTLFELIDALHGPRPEGAARQTIVLIKGARDKLQKSGLDARDRGFGFDHEFDRLRHGEKRLPRDEERAYDAQIEALNQTLQAVFLDGKRPFYCFGRAEASAEDALRELDALLERILPDLLGAPRPEASRREPKGLFSYGPEDHAIFFGRDSEIERALVRLEALAAGTPAPPMLLLTGRSGEGKSSVLRAGLTGRLGTGTLLLARAEIDARTDGGATPLHLAAQNGHAEVVTLLLNHAEIDARTEKGSTPLHMALAFGQHRAADLLLDHGARVDLVDLDGDAPLALALALGRDLLIPRLRALHPDPAWAEVAARRLLADPEKGVLRAVTFDALGLPPEAKEDLKQAIRAAAPQGFDVFCAVLGDAVRALDGDPRHEVARMQALRTRTPDEALAIARAAVEGSSGA